MKAKVLTVAIMFVMALGFSSCKKCTTCSYDFGTINYEEEYCGKSDEVEAFEDAAEAAAAIGGTTANCVRD